MAENKQEPRQVEKPGHEDGRTDTQTGEAGGERSVCERHEEDRGDKTGGIVKWRTGAFCETGGVEREKTGHQRGTRALKR